MELLLVGIFLLFIVVAIGLIVKMFISLSVMGDERRVMIIEKSATSTFGIIMGLLVLDIIEKMVRVFMDPDTPVENTSSFIYLTVAAIVFYISLVHNKRKFG
ncbi:hypothetical protein [Vagococcus fessus]|uniref:Uncharacterized protein n=1 Tax=Vagococcus fessus TaxID=120370 RepID=A0A430ABQ5_9ENTE|nr:hypothetical protein [Vagococcus fessus]RSU04646.1 hypothetical protein CBF31_01110 [Vagococcus fessus]